MSNHPADGSALDRALRAVLSVAVEGRIYPMFALLLGYPGSPTPSSRRCTGP